ncbi:MAG: CoA pyrophosphatase [Anaerolineae bacterium]|nr:CoA pyrophosphatase [Anaerolineae bacterium]
MACHRPDGNGCAPHRKSTASIGCFGLVVSKADAGFHIILTKRTTTLRGHSGQVSFPGGSMDEEDATYEDTALRETCEELGICDTSQIQILGRLSKMWIPPSNFDVIPVVATMKHEPKMTPSPFEVAKVLHMPLSALLDDATKRTTTMDFRGMAMDVPYYDVDGHIVWGATAGMLSEFEKRLKVVLKHTVIKDTKKK